MLHPSTTLKFISSEMGFGVFATEFIPKGTITWVQDNFDQVIPKVEYKKMEQAYKSILEYYGFRNNSGDYILCWDNGKYINHSFHSNCLSTAYDFEIAVRDIQIGEELTNDYGYLNIEQSFVPREENSSRKVVYPDDLLKYYPQWDRQIKDAFRYLHQLNQPLAKFFTDEEWTYVIAKSKKHIPIDSIICNYFKEEEND